MAERKPISKRTRFDVFKRDGFCCQYCGQKPPTVVLEIDHIHPVSEGGGNSKDNLITACFDCNRGKSNNLLTTMPESLQERAQFLQEKQDQLKAYSRLLKSIKKQEAEAVGGVELAFQEYYGDMSFTVKFRELVVYPPSVLAYALAQCDNLPRPPSLPEFLKFCKDGMSHYTPPPQISNKRTTPKAEAKERLREVLERTGFKSAEVFKGVQQ